MIKLIWLIKLSHGIEIGAYTAYSYHWRSLDNKKERKEVRHIQWEEFEHRNQLKVFLTELNSKPNQIIDQTFKVIGNTMGFLCLLTGYSMPMLGAGLIEIMGVINYKLVAKEALKNNKLSMAKRLDIMAETELKHRHYFMNKYKGVA